MKSSVQFAFLGRRTIISAVILVFVVSLLGSSTAFASASITTSVSPAPPSAIVRGSGAEVTGFTVTFDSSPDYAIYQIVDPYSNMVSCKFYDLSGNWGGVSHPWNKLSAAGYQTCYNTLVANRTYFDEHPGSSPFSLSGINWNVPGSAYTGEYTLTITYYSIGGGSTPEQTTSTPFLVADHVGTLILQAFEDVNANGIYDPGTDILWNNSLGPISLCYNEYEYLFSNVCQNADSNGQVVLTNAPASAIIIYEVEPDYWGPTTVTYLIYDLAASESHTQYFGNAHTDMSCTDSDVTHSAVDSSHQITYRFNYHKAFNDPALTPFVYLNFSGTAPLTASIISVTDSLGLTGWFDSGADFYGFFLPTILTPYDGYIDVVFQLAGAPTSGTFTANVTVASFDEPGLPDDNTCSNTIDFGPTAVTMASFTAQPQASGVGLSWWANVTGSDIVGFKIMSKQPSDSQYKDLPGAYIPADLNTAGANYAFIDTSAHSGITDYRLVPVTSGNGEGSPLSTTINYNKIFLPSIMH